MTDEQIAMEFIEPADVVGSVAMENLGLVMLGFLESRWRDGNQVPERVRMVMKEVAGRALVEARRRVDEVLPDRRWKPRPPRCTCPPWYREQRVHLSRCAASFTQGRDR